MLWRWPAGFERKYGLISTASPGGFGPRRRAGGYSDKGSEHRRSLRRMLHTRNWLPVADGVGSVPIPQAPFSTG